jgi:glycosyltransferase involved in cell wall biosynthesis
MRIAIATVKVPFVYGGAEIHAEELRNALAAQGHDAEIFALPFKWYPPERIIDHMVACRLFDLTESEGKKIDLLIGLKFPAYLIPHPHKVLWILHQHRQAYDLWHDPLAGDLLSHEHGTQVRDAIINADKQLIPSAKSVFANSRNVALRLKQHCGIDATPLYHPPRAADLFFSEPSNGYLFFPSRLLASKRQALVLEALARTKQKVHVKFAGTPNHPDYLTELKKTAARLGISDRVEWLGNISEEEKRSIFARCLAVIYPPVDEDFGYVTLEAMLSSKPVITCSDSGGPLEFIEDRKSGVVCEPNASSMAASFDELWADPSRAAQWGKAALDRYRSFNISWGRVVRSLLGDSL